MWLEGNNMSYANWLTGEPKQYNLNCQYKGYRAGIVVNITTGQWYTAIDDPLFLSVLFPSILVEIVLFYMIIYQVIINGQMDLA
uniref:C-type lectin domain-containing protein n=1 Tax=Acrobeloides nanus TaxID=290746 RepID=A0A914D5U7_9BILA